MSVKCEIWICEVYSLALRMESKVRVFAATLVVPQRIERLNAKDEIIH
jgi:hypothetical protein